MKNQLFYSGRPMWLTLWPPWRQRPTCAASSSTRRAATTSPLDPPTTASIITTLDRPSSRLTCSVATRRPSRTSNSSTRTIWSALPPTVSSSCGTSTTATAKGIDFFILDDFHVRLLESFSRLVHLGPEESNTENLIKVICYMLTLSPLKEK